MSSVLEAPTVKLPIVGLMSIWTGLFVLPVMETLAELELGTVLGLQLLGLLQTLETLPVQV